VRARLRRRRSRQKQRSSAKTQSTGCSDETLDHLLSVVDDDANVAGTP
jgi:hypothetical protein